MHRITFDSPFSFWLNMCDHHNRVKTVTTPPGAVPAFSLSRFFLFCYRCLGFILLSADPFGSPYSAELFILLTKNLPNALRRLFHLSFFAHDTINEFIWDTHISPDDDEVGRVPASPTLFAPAASYFNDHHLPHSTHSLPVYSFRYSDRVSVENC